MPLYHASIRDVPGRGRGIVADETVSPGTVLMEDEPYAAILLAHLAKERSQHSFQKSADLLRCQACKLVWYINKDEQKADWDVHKKECKALQACVKPQYAITWFQKAPVQNMTLRLCARALFRRAIEESSPENTKEAGTNFADIFSLMDHWDELEPEKKKGYIAEGTDIVKFMDPRGRQSSDREKQFEIAARLVAKSQCNSWIAEDNGSPTGQGLYPLGSLVNHSSRKNCELLFRGKTLVLTALNQLEKDEECTLSYRPIKTLPTHLCSCKSKYKLRTAISITTSIPLSSCIRFICKAFHNRISEPNNNIIFKKAK